MWQLQLYCYVKPHDALKLAHTLILARTSSPARWFALSHTVEFALTRFQSHARIRQNSFALTRSRSSTSWIDSLELAQTRLLACWLALTRTRSLSLELARQVLQNHSVFTRFLHAILQMNEFATCYQIL